MLILFTKEYEPGNLRVPHLQINGLTKNTSRVLEMLVHRPTVADHRLEDWRAGFTLLGGRVGEVRTTVGMDLSFAS